MVRKVSKKLIPEVDAPVLNEMQRQVAQMLIRVSAADVLTLTSPSALLYDAADKYRQQVEIIIAYEAGNPMATSAKSLKKLILARQSWYYDATK